MNQYERMLRRMELRNKTDKKSKLQEIKLLKKISNKWKAISYLWDFQIEVLKKKL